MNLSLEAVHQNVLLEEGFTENLIHVACHVGEIRKTEFHAKFQFYRTKGPRSSVRLEIFKRAYLQVLSEIEVGRFSDLANDDVT